MDTGCWVIVYSHCCHLCNKARKGCCKGEGCFFMMFCAIASIVSCNCECSAFCLGVSSCTHLADVDSQLPCIIPPLGLGAKKPICWYCIVACLLLCCAGIIGLSFQFLLS